MALILRYRQGTRVDIESSPFDDLRSFLAHRDEPGFPLEVLDRMITEELWGQWPRADARSTWLAILKECLRIHFDEVGSRVFAAQVRVLDALAEGGSPSEIWARVIGVMVSDLEELSGWNFSVARAGAALWPIQRAEDGRYFVEEQGRRIEVVGARTAGEAKLDYIADDSVRKYGSVARMCRLIALFCLYAHFTQNREAYPETIRVTLPEDAYLQWSWYHLSLLRPRRLPWLPPDRHSDPMTLGVDVTARFMELERNALPIPAPGVHEAVPHHEFEHQYEVALDTDLRFGNEDEAMIRYGNRDIRWINGSRTMCPVAIVGSEDREGVAARHYLSEFLSILCFETRLPVVPVGSVVTARRAAPMIVQPRKLADHLYPADLHLDIGRPLSGERRLALALYRDGVSSRSPYYEFLNLYKILQIRLPGRRVAAWINAHVDDNVPSVVRVNELRAHGIADIAAYLYGNWRNAIAHVERAPRLDPDDLEKRECPD